MKILKIEKRLTYLLKNNTSQKAWVLAKRLIGPLSDRLFKSKFKKRLDFDLKLEMNLELDKKN